LGFHVENADEDERADKKGRYLFGKTGSSIVDGNVRRCTSLLLHFRSPVLRKMRLASKKSVVSISDSNE